MEAPNDFYDLRCPDCGYTTTVKGRKGATGLGATVTISCTTCRELSDAITWTPQNPVYVEPRCPNGDDHPVAPWTFPGPCPKCGAQMGKTGLIAIVG